MTISGPHIEGPYFLAVGIMKNGDTAFSDIADTREQRWSAEARAQAMRVRKLNLYSLIDGLETGPLLTTGILREDGTFQWPGLAWFHISPDVKPDTLPTSVPDHVHVIPDGCDNLHILPVRSKIPVHTPVTVVDDLESPSP